MSDNDGAPGGTNNSQFHDQPGSFPQAYPPTGNYPPGGGYPPAGNYPPGGHPPTGDYPPGGYPPYGQPPKKGIPAFVWVILGLLVAAGVTIGVLFALGILGGDDEVETDETTEVVEPEPTVETTDASEEPTEEPTVPPTVEPTDEPTTPGVVFGYGDNAVLDALWDACAAGDYAACDDLYWASGEYSGYEEFGGTCGDIGIDGYGFCEGLQSGAMNAGDSEMLDMFVFWCENGDMLACDDLYRGSPLGSFYEEVGNSCGGSGMEAFGTCQSEEPEDYPFGPGDSLMLDAFLDSCEAGSFVDCDRVWWRAQTDSDYEALAATCGGRSEGQAGSCLAQSERF